MKEIKVKENLEKLLAVSGPIVEHYYELINKLKNGDSYDSCFSIISKLKIMISMEETVLNSFSKDEIDMMRQYVSEMVEISKNNKDMYSLDQVILMTRLSSLLIQSEEVLGGNGVVLQKNNSMTLSFGKIDSIMGFFNISSLLRLKDDLNNNSLNFSVSNDMKLSLIREMYLYMYTLFARYRFMELFFFLFYSEPNLDNLSKEDLKFIESVILGMDIKKYNDVLIITSGFFIRHLAILDIDVSDMDSINVDNSKALFDYLINMNRFENVLSYCNKEQFEEIEEYLDETYSIDEIRKLLGDEINDDTIEDYDGIKKIEFKSESVEEMVRQKIEEYKRKKRKK